MMLAFDTSSEFLSVAVGDSRGMHAVHDRAGHTQAERLIATIRQLLSDAGTSLKALDAIAFGAGPGAFTGLRIACGVAQGLAFAADRPLIAIGAFESVATRAGELAGERTPSAAPRTIRVAIDARMGEVYTALVTHGADGWAIDGEAGVLAPDAVPNDGDAAAGTGYAVFPALALRRGGMVFAAVVPEARSIIALANIAFARGELLDPADAAPVYLRDRVALTTVERQARAGVS